MEISVFTVRGGNRLPMEAARARNGARLGWHEWFSYSTVSWSLPNSVSRLRGPNCQWCPLAWWSSRPQLEAKMMRGLSGWQRPGYPEGCDQSLPLFMAISWSSVKPMCGTPKYPWCPQELGGPHAMWLHHTPAPQGQHFYETTFALGWKDQKTRLQGCHILLLQVSEAEGTWSQSIRQAGDWRRG